MGVYFRTSPRFFVTLPWWLAIPAGLVWLCFAMIYWMGWVLVGLALLAVRAVNRAGWRWQARHHPPE